VAVGEAEVSGEVLTLDAASLVSKFGFWDGDPPSWLEDRFVASWDDAEDEYGLLLNEWHGVLTSLVEERLVPAIRAAGHEVETYRIDGNHNPIRASSVDGIEYDGYMDAPFAWGEIEVSVPLDEVERLVREAAANDESPAQPEG
jgi:hypothetical protein